MNQLLTLASSAPAWLAYLVIGLLAFVESAAFVGLVFPGEAALVVGGVLAGTGHLSLPVLLTIAIVAAILGDSAGYEIGRLGGDAIKSSRPGRLIGEKRWAKAETFTRKHGNGAVVAGRWVGLMRALVPALAGMTLMPYRKFLLFNAIGGSLWATAVVLGGYFAGTSWRQLESALGNISTVAIGAAAAGVALLLLLRRRTSARSHV